MKQRQIHARLIEQGSNFQHFALAHGYKPRTVTKVVQRWEGSNGQPQGRLSFAILQTLSREIGREIVPGVLEQDGQTSVHCKGEAA